MGNGLVDFVKDVFKWGTFLPPKSSIRRGDRLLFATWLLILFTVLSGSVRKWMTGPGALGNFIFFIQLLTPFIFYFFISKRKVNPKFTAPSILFIFIIYVFIAALNPKNNTIYHGLFGIVIHLGFWICWLGYYQTRPIFEVEKFTNLLILILIGEVVLASFQNALPGTHLLNRFATGEENNTVVGKAVRVAGSFSYLGGFQAWVTFNGFFIWFLFLRRVPSIIILVVFALSLYAGFVSGARGAVGLLLMISLFGLLYSGYFIKRFFNLALGLILMTIITLFLGSGFVGKFGTAYTNFQSRITGEGQGELEGRIVGSFTEVLQFQGEYPIYGIGLGSTYQGANALFGQSTYLKEYGYYESESGRIVLEGGFILFFLRVILFLAMVRYSSIPLLGRVFLFILFINSMIVFNTYLSFFFFLGTIFVDRAYYLRESDEDKRKLRSRMKLSNVYRTIPEKSGDSE
jgi:hypothetical protein